MHERVACHELVFEPHYVIPHLDAASEISGHGLHGRRCVDDQTDDCCESAPPAYLRGVEETSQALETYACQTQTA